MRSARDPPTELPKLISTAAACAGITALTIPPAMRLAAHIGLVDEPGPLKVHDTAVPSVGGLGIVAALATAGGLRRRPALAAALGLALALGSADDALGLSPELRLAGETIIGALVASAIPTRLPRGLGSGAEVLATVTLINGVNMIDGLDGLAGGVTLASALGFASLLDNDGRGLAVALCGALSGFLLWNKPPARVYLGDGGSYVVGASMAALLAFAFEQGRPAGRSIGGLALVGFPVAELTFSVIRRARTRSRLTAGDRGHTYDRLVEIGWSRTRAASLPIAVQAGLTAIGLKAARMSPRKAAGTVACTTLALLAGAKAAGLLGPSGERS